MFLKLRTKLVQNSFKTFTHSFFLSLFFFLLLGLRLQTPLYYSSRFCQYRAIITFIAFSPLSFPCSFNRLRAVAPSSRWQSSKEIARKSRLPPKLTLRTCDVSVICDFCARWRALLHRVFLSKWRDCPYFFFKFLSILFYYLQAVSFHFPLFMSSLLLLLLF